MSVHLLRLNTLRRHGVLCTQLIHPRYDLHLDRNLTCPMQLFHTVLDTRALLCL